MADHQDGPALRQAIGYRLRETSAFAPVTLQTETLPDGSIAAPYAAKLTATGGIPFYHFEITAGSLPVGLELDPFTGELRGTPGRAGIFEFTVRVRDYDAKARRREPEAADTGSPSLEPIRPYLRRGLEGDQAMDPRFHPAQKTLADGDLEALAVLFAADPDLATARSGAVIRRSCSAWS